ncbi:MAG: transcriptional regulator [Candidatus Neomarinimicrobiota bacterium]|nr:MAG: transcriptional regulator [Candidatus Neomarinimicrobiota bacterium]
MSDDLLLLVSTLYYIEGLGQTRVAELAGISQATVSRLLEEARKMGIVQISVKPFSARDDELEEQLKERHNLNTVLVIKTIPGHSDENRRRALGHFAGPIISNLIQSNSRVCVAAGRHINSLTDNMSPSGNTPGVTFIQAMGDISTHIKEDDAIEITRKLSKRWNGQFLRLQAPAITENSQTYEAFVSHEQIKFVLSQIDNADLAFVGIGVHGNSVFYDRDFLKTNDINYLVQKGVVGEICGHFFNKYGDECNTAYRNHVIGVSLEQLKKIPQVIAVTSGPYRAEALAAAIRGNLINSLIIDDIGAKALMQLS